MFFHFFLCFFFVMHHAVGQCIVLIELPWLLRCEERKGLMDVVYIRTNLLT